ncbi:MAG: serine acetyltransferase, partial [Oscillospiraceae bacterium]|nr:serine acetyltransferase [Oscillospiraceae bacterium]
MNPIEQEIEGIVDLILEDYRHSRAIDKLTPKCDPDKEIIVDMIGKLMRIVYPSYSQEKTYRIYNARHNLSMLIEDVMYNLNKQIRLVLQGSLNTQDAAERAQELSLEFFRQIPQVRAVAQTDVEAFFEGDPAAFSVDEIIFCYPGLFAITVYRLAHILYELGVPMLPRIMTEHAHSITGIDINPGAT